MAQEEERLSSRANLLGLLLKVETERAEKYHNILLQLSGGDNALRVSRVPEGALICPTTGAPSEQAISRLPAEQGGPEVDRNNQAEVEGSVTVAAQSVRALRFVLVIDPMMIIYGSPRLRCGHPL
jgi:hypothetical protein